MRVAGLFIVLVALAACTPEPDYTAEFPAVPDSIADSIAEMDCPALNITRAGFRVLENSGALTSLLGGAALPEQVRPFVDMSETVREQAKGLTDRMIEVRECG
ncbi:MAG: hypothetical protein AAFQ36_12590 [Pseudomonadota bacterium]